MRSAQILGCARGKGQRQEGRLHRQGNTKEALGTDHAKTMGARQTRHREIGRKGKVEGERRPRKRKQREKPRKIVAIHPSERRPSHEQTRTLAPAPTTAPRAPFRGMLTGGLRPDAHQVPSVHSHIITTGLRPRACTTQTQATNHKQRLERCRTCALKLDGDPSARIRWGWRHGVDVLEHEVAHCGKKLVAVGVSDGQAL